MSVRAVVLCSGMIGVVLLRMMCCDFVYCIVVGSELSSWWL